MSLHGKNVAVSIPVFQLKEAMILQQINYILKAGAELFIVPGENPSFKCIISGIKGVNAGTDNHIKTLMDNNNLQAGQKTGFSRGKNDLFDLFSSLDILIVFSPQEELLKKLVSKKHSLLPARILLVITAGSEKNGEFLSLKYFSHLLQQEGVFFVPFGTVRCKEKKGEEIIVLSSRTDLLSETCIAALNNVQIQPVIWEYHLF